MNKKRLLRKLSREDSRITRNLAFVKTSGKQRPVPPPVLTGAGPEPPPEQTKRGRKERKNEQTD